MKKVIVGLGMTALMLNATELKVNVENIDVSRGGNLIVMIFQKDGLGFTNEQTILKSFGVPKYEKCKVTKEIYQNGISIKLVY